MNAASDVYRDRMRKRHGMHTVVWYYPIADKDGPHVEVTFSSAVYGVGPCSMPSESVLMIPNALGDWDCE